MKRGRWLVPLGLLLVAGVAFWYGTSPRKPPSDPVAAAAVNARGVGLIELYVLP